MKQDTDELIETCVSDVDLTIADAAEPAADTAPAPEEYSVLVLRNKVIFPGVLIPVTLGRQMSISLIEEALQKGLKIAVVCQKDQKITNPGAADIYTIGVLAHISRIIPEPGSNKVVLLQCEDRIRIDEITAEEPWLRAIVSHIPEEPASAADPETKAIADSLFKTAKQVLSDLDNGMEQIQLLSQLQGLDAGINHICSSFQSATEVMQSLLEESSMRTRADRMLRELHGFAVKQQVQKEIKIKTDQLIAKGQREYYLQQEIRAIREELGDTNDQQLQELRDRAERKEWTPEVKARFLEELRKLERIDPHMPDYSVQRTYLDLILDLPWGHLTVDNTSLPHAERVLNKDHFGMEEVKERILEYLASSRKSGMILCLWGPPGVGKTSLGRSIATALGRKYARIALGGMHDESELRGHRRTYIGAMPGRIIDSLKKVGTSNPVFVLDEIDKISADYHGDPTSALLEILDPEQNRTFHDNYLDIDYDLSHVLFIATANTLQSIPRPLLDRMELIEMSGYLQEEKEQISKRHLIPKQLAEQDLTSKDLRFSVKSIRTLIDDYTRESGVRELERQIAAVVRKVVKRRAMQQPYSELLQPCDIHTLLGKPRYSRERYEGNQYPGVVTGLAWTQVGGEILTIETTVMQSKTPALNLTGNLGDVMKESANIALSYIRSHATNFGIQPEYFDDKQVHLHVPEGAVPKDGPSAGITMTTAMLSCFTGRLVRPRIAMTGEMTLRGKVLPVGGIKEKILAAKRAGITDIVLCRDNEKDIVEIPAVYTAGLIFHYVSDIREVIDFALL